MIHVTHRHVVRTHNAQMANVLVLSNSTAILTLDVDPNAYEAQTVIVI